MKGPYVFLDVDGVLNPWRIRRFTPPKDAYNDFHQAIICNYSMMLSQEMADDFVDATRCADVRWLTTWLQDAPLHVAPRLDLPSWHWVDWSPTKVAAVQSIVAEDPRPFVWIDDEEATSENVEAVREHLIEHSVAMPVHLAIMPKDRTGLTRTHIAEIARFLEHHPC